MKNILLLTKLIVFLTGMYILSSCSGSSLLNFEDYQALHPINPSIELKTGSTNVAANGQYNFDEVEISTPIETVFTLTNTGTGSLIISGCVISGDSCFTISNVSKTEIPSKDTATITVKINPPLAQTYNGALIINTNDSKNSSFRIQLVAKGVNVKQPVFSVPGGSYTATQTLTLSCSTAGASIRYTIDGTTTPTEAVGTLYAGAITISSSKTIKAVSYKGADKSEVITQIYNMIPQIVVSLSGTTLTNDGANNDFGRIAIGTPTSQDFTITNTGGGVLNLFGAFVISQSVTGQFSVSITGSSIINPGLTSSVRVTFNPTAAAPSTSGILAVKVGIFSDDNNTSIFKLNVTGTRPYVLYDIGPAGGIIFYDKLSYSNGWRYLEAAPQSTEVWTGFGANGYQINGTLPDIGKGLENTNILNASPNMEAVWPASRRCTALTAGGFNDWFLPSKDELNQMYINLKLNSLGGFHNDTTGYYHSYDEPAWDMCGYQRFNDGYQYASYNTNSGYVRAARRF